MLPHRARRESPAVRARLILVVRRADVTRRRPVLPAAAARLPSHKVGPKLVECRTGGTSCNGRPAGGSGRTAATDLPMAPAQDGKLHRSHHQRLGAPAARGRSRRRGGAGRRSPARRRLHLGRGVGAFGARAGRGAGSGAQFGCSPGTWCRTRDRSRHLPAGLPEAPGERVGRRHRRGLGDRPPGTHSPPNLMRRGGGQLIHR